jgi:hypothetical protein
VTLGALLINPSPRCRTLVFGGRVGGSIIGRRRRTTRSLPSPSSPAPETLQRPDALR